MQEHTPHSTSRAAGIVLASASPRRLELLRQVGFHPRVQPAHVEEVRRPGESARDYVRRLAGEKACAVASILDDVAHAPWILAADTVVVVDDDVLEKPRDRADASAMLRRLSGRGHRVLTGVAVVDARTAPELEPAATVVATEVVFDTLDETTIARYVATAEPMDKAGGYGIQGVAAGLVVGIEGSYTNVVGLPLHATIALLRRVGAIDAWPFTDPGSP